MTFGPRNTYYLRISTSIVLPLFLYLDERHTDWMSDVVLQHVLADLRPLIIPKLQAEKDVHFGSGSASGNKRGTVEVHRGGTYQFAYFFRKTEPHTVLFKSRYFVTAPLRPELAPRPASSRSRLADRNPQKKRLRTQVSAKQSKRKRAKTKGKDKISQIHLDEDEWSAGESEEEDTDGADPMPREPRLIRKQHHIIVDAYQEDDGNNVEDMRQDDVATRSPPPEDGGSSGDPGVPDIEEGGAVAWGANNQPSLSLDAADIELAVEEEERKPKPLLKLKYQSLPISGHCLCVVVEPWPPLRAQTRSVGLGTSFQRGSLEPSLLPSNGSVMAGERAKTPLFFPEYDKATSEAPSERARTLPPVPLFYDAMSKTKTDGHSNDDLMNFSQTLNAAGHMHTITADDDDDMDGAVLFGDADEVRELF